MTELWLQVLYFSHAVVVLFWQARWKLHFLPLSAALFQHNFISVTSTKKRSMDISATSKKRKLLWSNISRLRASPAQLISIRPAHFLGKCLANKLTSYGFVYKHSPLGLAQFSTKSMCSAFCRKKINKCVKNNSNKGFRSENLGMRTVLCSREWHCIIKEWK